MTATLERPSELAEPARARSRSGGGQAGQRLIRVALLVAAIIPTAALAFLVYQMVNTAYPAIIFNGTRFFTTKTFSMGFHRQVPYLTSVIFTDLSLPGAWAHATSAAAGTVTPSCSSSSSCWAASSPGGHGGPRSG